jgi:hypothetical protein
MGEMGLGERDTHTKHGIELMINKHENISVDVCWDDVGVPG